MTAIKFHLCIVIAFKLHKFLFGSWSFSKYGYALIYVIVVDYISIGISIAM